MTILCLTLFVILLPKLSAAPVLVDRLVVEMSGKSYSQKQMEVYTLLRTIAMGEPARSGLPSSDLWAVQLEDFKNAMIIVTQLENEPTKMESFLPDSQRLIEAEKALSEVQSKDKEVDAFIRQRGLSDADLNKSLTMILRVEGYTRSRQQLAQMRPIDEKGPNFVKLDPSLPWFQALLKGVAYRYYSFAKEYKTLSPLR